MLARPELLLPLAFSLSGLMIVAALVLLRIGARQSRRANRLTAASCAEVTLTRAQTMNFGSSASLSGRPEGHRRAKRKETLHLFSGATMAALEQATRSNPTRKRQRMYS